jgi:hypothetical protein
MRYDQKPVHRKWIAPWYDSNTVCVILMVVVLVALVFSFTGISVAMEEEVHRGKIWLPIFLALLCIGVMASLIFRLARRIRYQRKDLEP